MLYAPQEITEGVISFRKAHGYSVVSIPPATPLALFTDKHAYIGLLATRPSREACVFTVAGYFQQ
jgi:hypothetical protein